MLSHVTFIFNVPIANLAKFANFYLIYVTGALYAPRPNFRANTNRDRGYG